MTSFVRDTDVKCVMVSSTSCWRNREARQVAHREGVKSQVDTVTLDFQSGGTPRTTLELTLSEWTLTDNEVYCQWTSVWKTQRQKTRIRSLRCGYYIFLYYNTLRIITLLLYNVLGIMKWFFVHSNYQLKCIIVFDVCIVLSFLSRRSQCSHHHLVKDWFSSYLMVYFQTDVQNKSKSNELLWMTKKRTVYD